MIVNDRTDADDATFAAERDRIEAAPAAAESWSTRWGLAQRLFEVECDGCGCGGWTDPLTDRGVYLEMADAAISSLAGPLADLVRQRDEALAKVARVAALAEEYDDGPGWDMATYHGRVVRDRIRAALGGRTEAKTAAQHAEDAEILRSGLGLE